MMAQSAAKINAFVNLFSINIDELGSWITNFKILSVFRNNFFVQNQNKKKSRSQINLKFKENVEFTVRKIAQID